LDYGHFQDLIQSGILLNIPAYIQMAVHQIKENYDFAESRYWDNSVAKCADAEAARGISGTALNVMKAAFSIWNDGSDEQAQSKAFACKGQAANTRAFAQSLAKLMNFDGSVLDVALPQNGQSHDRDLIERQAIASLGRELGILSGTRAMSPQDGESVQRRDELIKSLLRVLAFDYEGELAKQKNVSAVNSKFQYIFATNAPGKNEGGDLNVGQSYPVKTIGRIKLYVSPIAKANHESILEVSLNDVVEILPIDDSGVATVAGWVKVLYKGYEAWMPSWPLTAKALVDEQGQPIPMAQVQDCAAPRVVTSLTNFRRSSTLVPRFSSNIKTEQTSRRSGIWQIDADRTATVAAASTSKTYIACTNSNFLVNGQTAMRHVPENLLNANGVDYSRVQAIRIIEARQVRAANGETLYLPQEEYGGFVQTWLPRIKSNQPRIVLGNELDPTTWSIRK
jgi:hypothetical protein